MTVIESETLIKNTAPETIYNFMADLHNHIYIMPTEVEHYIATESTCSYTITGTGNLSLTVEEKEFPMRISMKPEGKRPFEYQLTWYFEKHGSDCLVRAVLEADLNLFIKSIAQQPLQNFINLQVSGLKKYAHENLIP